MAGLLIRELLTRARAQRVLVVPPAGLLGNWEREMRGLFNLPFRIVSGAEARPANPFADPDDPLHIVSVDTLAGGRMLERLQEPDALLPDLVIFDEAHKLSADRRPEFTLRRSERYKLAEWLANRVENLLLLTATPHMGKDFPYYCLWRLLEPEILSTVDAFNAYPREARARHMLRRLKEEMRYFDNTPIFKARESRTVSYDLREGEQRLYDETTAYIQEYYNRARILNRSAARLVMSVYQRRLASSTYALLCSFRRRADRLRTLVEDIERGRISFDELLAQQRRLDDELQDILDEATGDEETAEEGREENERVEERAAARVVATNVAELRVELERVEGLARLAQAVYDTGEESKFEKLREAITHPDFAREKLLIFTEHRDTLTYLVTRLEGLGYAGQVAQIHGGMLWEERDAQVEAFRGPCRFLVATDAAGEGINLQIACRMVNFDIPWNPARLEQRMGRIHRYGQKRDVIFANIVAGKTREGRVLLTLLTKLERIRKELKSDKVFDVIGRLFEGVSLKDLMMAAIEGRESEAEAWLEGTLTPEQARARIESREKLLATGGGDVAEQLSEQKNRLRRDEFLRLLPGYVRRFVEKSAPLLGARVEGDLDGHFRLRGLPDPLLPFLEEYEPERRNRLTVKKPRSDERVVFLHPGQPFFDRYRKFFAERFSREALRGGAFIDPEATRPYLVHVALVSVIRRADPELFPAAALLERKLLGIRQEPGAPLVEAPVEHLMLLRAGAPFTSAALVAAQVGLQSLSHVAEFARDTLAGATAESRRSSLRAMREDRERQIQLGYDYHEAELAEARVKLRERAAAGDGLARAELEKVKARQVDLAARRERALRAIEREPDLISVGEPRFIAHALVVPSSDPADREAHDAEIELIAMRVARAYEESLGARVEDVCDPRLKKGFDLLSFRPDEAELAIEVKGRARVGAVELSENEWAKAATLREKYWLYVVYDCGTAHPRLLRIQDPFGRLLARLKGNVLIDADEILGAAEADGT